ncbi:hypothetical protein HOB87_11080, partial [Candidatus Woesearchaeota archaeon]|nr:hypothetical protein [Candidatus Woesearchaeota archaeon]
MLKHSLKPVKLNYSKPIKESSSVKPEQVLDRKRNVKLVDGKVIDKSIHAYRMWFLFLKLGLELEQQKTVLIMKNSSRINSWEKTEKIIRKVKVDKRKYRKWDLDQVLTLPFNTWWKTHGYLFLDEVSKVLKPNDVVLDDSNYLTIQIDKRRRLTDVIKDLRDLNDKKKIFVKKERGQFSINGSVRPLTLLNRYNCLILKLQGELSNSQIIEHKNRYIRVTDKRMVKQGSYTIPLNQYEDLNYARVIFDLISGTKKSFGAKQILLSVCDGY